MNKTYEKYIEECFSLARENRGKTSPNPLVGSVIVKNGNIISRGSHKKSGLAHAELDAIQNAKVDLKGATLYCNLEPCCHLNKKTPPCAQEIVKVGISKVVISNLDPNPNVAGKGVALLKAAGIEVIQDVLKSKGEILNEVFFTHIQKRRPFIHLKWAQTLDGKIATLEGSSKWITNHDSRQYAHQERALYDSILVGANTINQDNPSLTVRVDNKKIECKKRIILAGENSLKSKSKVFTDEYKDQTLIVSNRTNADLEGIKTLDPEEQGQAIDISKLLSTLYNKGICSIYVEGGMNTIAHFINAEIFDRVTVFIAPKLLGAGISLNSNEIASMQDAINFSDEGVWTQLKDNMRFESKRNICLQD